MNFTMKKYPVNAALLIELIDATDIRVFATDTAQALIVNSLRGSRGILHRYDGHTVDIISDMATEANNALIMLSLLVSNVKNRLNEFDQHPTNYEEIDLKNVLPTISDYLFSITISPSIGGVETPIVPYTTAELNMLVHDIPSDVLEIIEKGYISMHKVTFPVMSHTPNEVETYCGAFAFIPSKGCDKTQQWSDETFTHVREFINEINQTTRHELEELYTQTAAYYDASYGADLSFFNFLTPGDDGEYHFAAPVLVPMLFLS